MNDETIVVEVPLTPKEHDKLLTIGAYLGQTDVANTIRVLILMTAEGISKPADAAPAVEAS